MLCPGSPVLEDLDEPATSIARFSFVQRILSLDADEGPPTLYLIPATKHAFRYVGSQAVILFHHEIKTNILYRLKQILALNPERAAIVPGSPPVVFSISE